MNYITKENIDDSISFLMHLRWKTEDEKRAIVKAVESILELREEVASRQTRELRDFVGRLQ